MLVIDFELDPRATTHNVIPAAYHAEPELCMWDKTFSQSNITALYVTSLILAGTLFYAVHLNLLCFLPREGSKMTRHYGVVLSNLADVLFCTHHTPGLP